MESARENNPVPTFSISNILQDEEKPETIHDVTSVTYTPNFGRITTQNLTRSSAPVQYTPQNCLIGGKPPQTSIFLQGITPNETTDTGLKNRIYRIYTVYLLK